MLNIVLLEPEIPQNTGNIARTCVAFNATLHLIKPYGFILDDKKVVRSGLDYWKNLKLKEYNSYQEFLDNNDSKTNEFFYITRYGLNTPDAFKYDVGSKAVYFIFGKESTGIDKNILKQNKKNTIRIPSSNNVRSLNLSNCVALIAFEAIKQSNYSGLEKFEPFKKNQI